MKKRTGFAIAQIMVILLVSSILIIAAMPMMTMKKKMVGGNNADVIKCIVTESASNLSSSVCSTAISGALKERDNSFNTILSYVDSSNTTQSGAAKKVLREVCRQGGENACKYFMNKCLLSNSECNNASSDYDLHYFLTLAYSDSAANKVLELIDKHYKLSEANILNSLNNACTLSNNSAGCKFLMDKCYSKDEKSCRYFVNRCKDDAACNIVSSNYDLYYFLTLNIASSVKNVIESLVKPLYISDNTNIVNAVDNACSNTHPYSIACSYNSVNEENCLKNNDEAACSAIADQCSNTSNLKKCYSIVVGCNSGKSNACKYGYLFDINRSCFQIKSKISSLYESEKTYRLANNIDGSSVSLYCTGDWTRLVYEYFSSTGILATWNISQANTNRVRSDSVDAYGIAHTSSYWVLGGQGILSGTGYSPDMYVEKTYNLLNIPHQIVKPQFYAWYCGPWNGDRFYLYFNDYLDYTSPLLYNTTPSSWKAWDLTQDCRNQWVDRTINSSENAGKFRIYSNSSSDPTSASFGIADFRILLK